MSKDELEIDLKKVIANCTTTPTEELKAIGKVNWHTRFIKYLAYVACPLYTLEKKDVVFKWLSECHQAFEMLKKMLLLR